MIRFDMREERPVVQEVEKDNTKNDDKSIHEQMLNGHIWFERATVFLSHWIQDGLCLYEQFMMQLYQFAGSHNHIPNNLKKLCTVPLTYLNTFLQYHKSSESDFLLKAIW